MSLDSNQGSVSGARERKGNAFFAGGPILCYRLGSE